MDIFELKMKGKSGLEFFYFEIQRAPSEKSAQKDWIGLAG